MLRNYSSTEALHRPSSTASIHTYASLTSHHVANTLNRRTFAPPSPWHQQSDPFPPRCILLYSGPAIKSIYPSHLVARRHAPPRPHTTLPRAGRRSPKYLICSHGASARLSCCSALGDGRQDLRCCVLVAWWLGSGIFLLLLFIFIFLACYVLSLHYYFCGFFHYTPSAFPHSATTAGNQGQVPIQHEYQETINKSRSNMARIAACHTSKRSQQNLYAPITLRRTEL
jgi:hypothetical protein